MMYLTVVGDIGDDVTCKDNGADNYGGGGGGGGGENARFDGDCAD